MAVPEITSEETPTQSEGTGHLRLLVLAAIQFWGGKWPSGRFAMVYRDAFGSQVRTTVEGLSFFVKSG